MRTRSPQEEFWLGQFGADYTARNRVDPHDRGPFFARVLQTTFGVRSICELGANRGHNLAAIRALSTNYRLTGVELNPAAYEEMRRIDQVRAHLCSIQEFQTAERFDLVFTCGVLIHVCPDDLEGVYRKMFDLSARYVLVNEYFNPSPVEIPYRGHSGRLFKRDFAGEMLDLFGGRLAVVDYGFLWHRRAPSWDDTTWVLMEKAVPDPGQVHA